MNVKFMVFISSTYEDLKEERLHAVGVILNLGDIPAGMELFPASNDDPLTLIKKVIVECDYYILILGGKYGSLTKDGISFTEAEFDFAQEMKIPTMTFVHEDRKKLDPSKVEQYPEALKKLDAFIEKVKKTKTVKYFKNATDLGVEISTSLTLNKKEFPRQGWTKGTVPLTEETDNPPVVGDNESSKKVKKKDKNQPAIYKAIDQLNKSTENADKLFEKAIKKVRNKKEKEDVTAFYYYMRSFHVSDSLKRLESLYQDSSADSRVGLWYAHALLRKNSYHHAKDIYDKVAKDTEDEGTRAAAISRSSVCSMHMGESSSAIETLETSFPQFFSSEAKDQVLNALAVIYTGTKQYEMAAIIEHLRSEIVPDNYESRFQAAYKFGEATWKELSLYLYNSLEQSHEPSSATINNYGVCLKQFDLNILAINEYKRAKADNSLACANLARQYLEAGFEEEAEKISKEALKYEFVHSNVNETIGSIARYKKTQEEKLSKILEDGKRLSNFMMNFGFAWLNGKWPAEKWVGKWALSTSSVLTIGKSVGTGVSGSWLSAPKLGSTGIFDIDPVNPKATNLTVVISLLRGSGKMEFLEGSLEVARGHAYLTDTGNSMKLFVRRDNRGSHEFCYFDLPRMG